MKLSVIIPAYNEEKTIGEIIRMVANLDFEKYGFTALEVIVVDDGSTDSTYARAQNAIKEVGHTVGKSCIIKVVKQPLNRGKGAAIRVGLGIAEGDIVAIQDADLEYHPQDILDLAALLVEKNADVVYGSRFLKRNPVIYTRYYLGNRLISVFISLLFFSRVTDAYTCRKIFKGEFLKKIKLESDGFEIESEITSKIFRAGAVYLESPIGYAPRTIEEGKKISWLDAVKGVTVAVKYRLTPAYKFIFSNDKPKICVLSARFHPHLGGTEKQALEVVSRLKKDGYRLFVLTQRYSQELLPEEEVDGIRIIRLGTGGGSAGFLSSVIFMIRAFVFLALNRDKYDIIQVLLASSPALVASLLSLIFKEKKVAVKLGGARRTGDISTSQKSFWGRLKLCLLKKSPAIFICPSDEVRLEMLGAGFRQEIIRVIPNGVDVEKFAPLTDVHKKNDLRQKIGIPLDSVVITYLGRFAEGKGIETLIEAFDMLEKKFSGVFLVLAGDGELRDFINKKIAGRKNVFVTDSSVDKPQDYLAASDIFVLPSSGEGLSNSLLEAMSSGLAVVVSGIPANRQVISDGQNGLIVATGDKNLLAQALERLLLDEKLRLALGLSARKTVIENYSITKTVEMYKKLYSEIRLRDISVDGEEIRFGFGDNWQRYSQVIDEERIKRAEESLKDMLGVGDLRGLSFIDVGSGSGLFSLAALRLGAKTIRSFDYDISSVRCARMLKEKFYPDAQNWIIEQGSILDEDYVKSLGEYDIVYSWGVLHHTGDLYKAMRNVIPLVKKDGGKLFIAIYNTQKILTPLWKFIKKRYVRGGFWTRNLLLSGYISYCVVRWFISDITRLKNPISRWKNYRRNRGMSFLRDARDWVGGYPFETATVDEVKEFFERSGFSCLKVVPSGGSGNNEFVFVKKP